LISDAPSNSRMTPDGTLRKLATSWVACHVFSRERQVTGCCYNAACDNTGINAWQRNFQIVADGVYSRAIALHVPTRATWRRTGEEERAGSRAAKRRVRWKQGCCPCMCRRTHPRPLRASAQESSNAQPKATVNLQLGGAPLTLRQVKLPCMC
jgi:hypothetical protein